MSALGFAPDALGGAAGAGVADAGPGSERSERSSRPGGARDRRRPGIGRASAMALARAGADVAVADLMPTGDARGGDLGDRAARGWA